MTVLDRYRISFFIYRSSENPISPTFCGGIWPERHWLAAGATSFRHMPTFQRAVASLQAEASTVRMHRGEKPTRNNEHAPLYIYIFTFSCAL